MTHVTALLPGAAQPAAAAPPTAADTGCRVAYSVSSQWPGGFTAAVAVTNLGDRVDGWTLGWTFSAGQRVDQAWNATVTATDGRVTAVNTSYNATIATVTFGFTGSWTQSNPVPTTFTLNGVTCTGSTEPGPQPG